MSTTPQSRIENLFCWLFRVSVEKKKRNLLFLDFVFELIEPEHIEKVVVVIARYLIHHRCQFLGLLIKRNFKFFFLIKHLLIGKRH